MVVLAEEAAAAVPPALDLLGHLLVQALQQALSFFVGFEACVGPGLFVLLGDVEIFELEGVVSADPALNLLSLSDELRQLLVVVVDHLF